jgi:hypothetical protein
MPVVKECSHIHIVENTAQITYTDDGTTDTASINNEGKLQINGYVFIKQ